MGFLDIFWRGEVCWVLVPVLVRISGWEGEG